MWHKILSLVLKQVGAAFESSSNSGGFKRSRMVLGIYLSNSESHVNLGSGYGVEVGGVGGWGVDGLLLVWR